MREPVPVSRRSRWIVAPLLVVLTLAGAWTGLWFYAARKAEATIAAWIDREAQVGRVYTCGTRSIGGYPFRIEVRCAAPSVELRGASAPLALTARELLAVAQVYRPDLVIAEVTGPLTVAEAGNPVARAEWTLMQASVRGLPRQPERVSIMLEGVKLQRAGSPETELASARQLEFHVRPHPAAGGGRAGFDLAASVSQAVVSAVPALAGRPLDVQANAMLSGISDLTPKPLAVRLREWQAAGGRFELVNARVQQGDAVAVARGDLGLTPSGRLDGALNLTMAGFEDIARLLGLPNLQVRGQSGLLAGLSAMLGGQAELEGKRAASVPLRFNDGAVFFGPIPLGQTGPLF